MNCKQGDMAVIIRSEAGNEGKVVTCLNFVGNPPPTINKRGGFNCYLGNDYWLVDRKLNCTSGSIEPYARDSALMPITPDEQVTTQTEQENPVEEIVR